MARQEGIDWISGQRERNLEKESRQAILPTDSEQVGCNVLRRGNQVM